VKREIWRRDTYNKTEHLRLLLQLLLHIPGSSVVLWSLNTISCEQRALDNVKKRKECTLQLIRIQRGVRHLRQLLVDLIVRGLEHRRVCVDESLHRLIHRIYERRQPLGRSGPARGVGDEGVLDEVQGFNYFVPDEELRGAFHEEHERQVEGEVEEGPDLLADVAEVDVGEPVEVDHVEEVLRLGLGMRLGKDVVYLRRG
jgi:hypothetical protein